MNEEQHLVPITWEISKLENIAILEKGKKPKNLGEKNDVYTIPYIVIKAFEQKIFSRFTDGFKCRFCNKDDVLIVWDGARAGLVGTGVAGALGSTLGKLVNFGLYSKFIYYFIQSKFNFINSNPRGVGIPHVDPNIFWSIEVPIPPLAEQVRIVGRVEELFSRLDAGVRSLQAAQTQLEQYRQATLKQAYTGKLTEKWRHEKYHLSESENTQTIPETWKHLSIEDISLNIIDCLHSTPKFVEKGKYCIDTTCIKPNKIKFDKVRYVSEETYKKRIRRLEPEHGDVLFSREGTIGTALLVPENIELCLGQRMMMFRPNNNILSKYFMWGLLSPIFRNQWKQKVTGTTAPHVNIRDIRKMTLPIAPLDEQKRITISLDEKISLLDYIFDEINQIFQVSSYLKKSISKRAFEGRLVPQDPNDESAQVLLERIKAQKEQKRKLKR